MNAIPEIQYRPEGPQPLLREIPLGEDYPVSALGPLRDAVETAHMTTQAPVAIAAQSALSLASLATQAHADVETLAGSCPISLFCLTVARSGERKSATDKVLMSGLREFERIQSQEYGIELDSHKNTLALWKVDRDQILNDAKKRKGANRIAAEADLKALGPEPKPPRLPNLTATEPTFEGLQKLFAVGQPALGLFSDEGSQFLGGYAMSNDNRMKTIGGLSSLWDAQPINRTRSGDGQSTLHGRRLAVHLMVQPIAARPLLADPIANGQGFLARFLITEPPSAIGTRISKGPCSNVANVAYSQRLNSILEACKPVSEHDRQELKPRVLPLSADARTLLVGFYNAVERAQAAGGEFEHVTSFASKSAEQAARIAGVLSLWRSLDVVEVTAHTMADAITLAGFYLGEAKRLAEAATISLEIDLAEQLRVWLRDSWPEKANALDRSPHHIVPRDVVQYGPNSLRETKKAKKVLKTLEEAGWITLLPEGQEIDGAARKTAYLMAETKNGF
ncbi:MAG: YfjI family protein [Paracoccaceae bacterium]